VYLAECSKDCSTTSVLDYYLLLQESNSPVTGWDLDDLWWYLNHTNVSAIFTIQHQWLDHPKVFSVPLGSQKSVVSAI
jgi:hypothetical protein